MEGAVGGHQRQTNAKETQSENVYITVIRVVLLYGLETCALTRKEKKILQTTEMGMLRRIMGVTLRDRKRNDDMRKELKVCIITEKARECRLRWFGHLQRADDGKPAKDIMSRVL